MCVSSSFLFCRVAAEGGIRFTSGHYDRRNSIVVESNFGHVTGPLKTLTYQSPGNGSVALKNTGFLSGEHFRNWVRWEREIWKSPNCCRFNMYTLFHESKMIISIPSSDSSPRSVYEAIFCGSPVCITHHPYYDSLPDCIKERIVLVDLNDKNWFIFALEKAKVIAKNEFSPTEEAIDLFDQRKSFKIILKLIDQ